MAGVHLHCLSCFITCSSVLLLGVCLHDVEASSCDRVIHKKVGETVELSTCSLSNENLTAARWKYGESIIVDKDQVVSEKQFKGRLHLNPTDFSLTLRRLTLQDSGHFSFVSAVEDKQRETVIINLQVHEPITEQPLLIYNSTWHNLNESCTVLLECSTTADGSVSYNWTVRNQTRSGSRLQYIVIHKDTKFTCTIYNLVSEMSASKSVKCSNETQEPVAGQGNHVILLAAAGGGLLIVIVLGIAVGVCYCKQSQPGSDTNDLTVYADISEVTAQEEISCTMKPCSVYETIDNRVSTVTPGPQTVYDKIQLSRVRKTSVSPYQDIS